MDETYYSNFKRVYETDSSIEANEYLELGWVLLNVVKTQTAKESWTTYYVLGWDGKVEDIKRGRTFGERLKSELKEKRSENEDSQTSEDDRLDIFKNL